jgi:hypothetical protein
MRWFAKIPGLIFGLFVLWKLTLVIFTSQPVPANDAFFYDGPVVNYLLHGKYCNPSLAMVLPISGNDVYCAYPPLYQFVLLAWMKLFGTSVLAAMYLHLTLLFVYGLTVLAIFRRLRIPPVWVNFACLFLVSITGHDRPDTLAHVLGLLAIFASVCGYLWLSATFLLLTFCTSLQISSAYLLWIGLMTLVSVRLKQIKPPWMTGLILLVAFLGLIGLVKIGFPHLWEGFRQHVEITPSVTGWRLPGRYDLLRVARNAPGILLVGTWTIWLLLKGRICADQIAHSRSIQLALAGMVTAFALIVVTLVILAPYTGLAANYLQPIIVGCFLGALGEGFGRTRILTGGTRASFVSGHVPAWGSTLLVIAVLVASIRGVAMTMWGLACTYDLDRESALKLVRQETLSAPIDSVVFASSAYLYEVARRSDTRFIHSDWFGLPNNGTPGFVCDAVVALRPRCLLLTQFDYFRRYDLLLKQVKTRPELVSMRILNTAQTPVPDSFPGIRRVVQHVSWAPVIVKLEWKEPSH